MNSERFRDVNFTMAARLNAQTVTVMILSLIILLMMFYIITREEVVIERPMFSMDREMILVRNRATRSVAQVWAYNAVSIFGNISPKNIAFAKAEAYSLLDSKIADRLEIEHDKLVRMMKDEKISIRFEPDKDIDYEFETGIVTIRGTRIIESLVDKEQRPVRTKYQYQVKVELSGFSPWISVWMEGEIKR